MGRPKINYKYAVKFEKFCIGALCRGEKKFISYDGARLCKRCRSHNKYISDCDASVSSVEVKRSR